MDKNKKIMAMGLLVLALVLSQAGIQSFVYNKKLSDEKGAMRETITKELEAKYTEEEMSEVDEATGDKYSASGAIEAAQALLNAITSGDEDTSTRLEKILKDEDAKGEDVLSEEVFAMLHSNPPKALEEDFIDMAAVSLLMVADTLQEMSNKTNEVIIDNPTEFVYFDNDMRIASVPVDVFVGGTTGLSLTFGYLNGEWKYLPYQHIESIVLISTLELN